MRVVIADGDRFFRAGLALLLRERGIDVVGEASDRELALRAVRQTAPDVLVIDLRLVGVSGAAEKERIRDAAAATGVLLVSPTRPGAGAPDGILSGAGGYVFKDQPVHEIVQRIRSVAQSSNG